MRRTGTGVEISASDLSWFLGCRHRTALDLAVAWGVRSAPTWLDPAAALLEERGLEHETKYIDSLRMQGIEITDLSAMSWDDAARACLDAMRSGRPAIVQGALRDGRWFGRPDVLRRVETPSSLGAWSYEPVDTKLARETRGGTILQLSLYSELIRAIQAISPEFFHVVTPDSVAPVQTFRVGDFAAYFRLTRDRMAAFASEEPTAIAAVNYPEPVEHCAYCRWWNSCDRKWRDDDHLSLVAGISRLQRCELQLASISTLAALANVAIPLPFRPRRGASETYVRVREQARVQLAGRSSGAPVHELLPITPEHGFYKLPAPADGDVFLDLEGDSFACEGGREYLFGFALTDSDGNALYRSLWADSASTEKAAFEATVDAILQSWGTNPSIHVYHFGAYETATFKRLMGRHSTRETEMDRMLRAGLFVDLHSVVKRSLRASVEKYSIKDLEPFFGFRRSVPLETARPNLRLVERALELGQPRSVTETVRDVVEGYNRDDCLSALGLRKWLEELRSSAEGSGITIPRPTQRDSEPSQELSERERRARELSDAILAGVPPDKAQRNAEQQARWLLANLLGWHRREEKAPWWEFYRLCDLSEEELLEERAAIAGLRFSGRVGGTAKCPIDRYRYPFQDTDVRRGDELHLSDGTTLGTVEEIARGERTTDVKKRSAYAETHPSALFAFNSVPQKVLEEAVFRIGEDVIEHGMTGGSRYLAAKRLLLGEAPRLKSGRFQPVAGETPTGSARRVVCDLDETVLAIQGPPGAGKTYAGAEMICDLVAARKRVGVTAVSHKVIRKFLDTILERSKIQRVGLTCVQKVPEKSKEPPPFEETTKSEVAAARISSGMADVLGGTVFLWARPEFQESVDVLFVDEAGQMSLADVLAASHAARSVVLLGDPQQLEQPIQGSHPEGTALSALDHLLQGEKTIRDDRGIFLRDTWRLSPPICAFTSEVFYESRLQPLPGLELQKLVGRHPFQGSGLWVVPVEHGGNQSSSLEEVQAVERIVSALLEKDARWTDWKGREKPMTPSDVLIVAPYNAQVARLEEKLSLSGIRAGTVDKFQGQEAPVVIYSMATSSSEDAPRGMEFLYSLNRLNVATSRARCACILVASPRLLEPECKTPRQMQLANALCRYAELARIVDLS